MNCNRCGKQDSQIRYGNYPLCDDCYIKSENLFEESQQEDKIRERLLYIEPVEINIMSNDRIEAHTKFFNHERILVTSMSDSELRERIEELESIAVEVKAKLAANNAEKRERDAKKTLSQKAWLVTAEGGNPSVSDSLATVKVRKDRMTKADKLREQMRSLGVEGVDELMKNVGKATEKQFNQISFNKDKAEVKKEVVTEPSKEDFDPSSLFG